MYVISINDEVVSELETFSEAYEKAHTILTENNTYSDTVV